METKLKEYDYVSAKIMNLEGVNNVPSDDFTLDDTPEDELLI